MTYKFHRPTMISNLNNVYVAYHHTKEIFKSP